MKKWVLLLKDYVSPKGTLDRKGFWIVFLGANLSIILFYVTFYLLFGLSVKWNLYLSYYVGVGLVVLCGGLLPLGAVALAGATCLCIDQDFFSSLLALFVDALFVWYWFLCIRRCHDMGRSWWYSLIPFYNPFVLLFKRSQEREN
ncbi:MAG: DUF805 domain-containing protein [Bacteroidaceae bacterium]|nr:DUF805 domain-containing protein [Bacteroidaceae bacterium]